MKKRIDYTAVISPTDWADMVTHLRTAETTLATFSVSLTNKERLGKRTVAEGREGYVREVYRIADEFQNSLPRSFDIALFKTKLELFDQYKSLLVQLEKLAEMADDTTIQLGSELMEDTDTVYPVLQTMRKIDPNLDRAMDILDEYNTRFGAQSATLTPPDPDNPPI
jgi:hypothetical protein